VTFLCDTSVWISYFRDPEGQIAYRLDSLLDEDRGSVVGCPPVRMELSMDDQDLRRRRVLRVYDGFRTVGIMDDDFDLAAEVYRAARTNGHTIRSQLDCIIAAIAMRSEAVLVHNDIDFDRMAEVVDELAVLRLPDR
jgi:predicted nucleic acid-binding protein